VKQRPTYHHGNLREALLDAAVALMAEVGVQAFTLREVARRAGVSHNAPYRHFRDKDDLLAAVAAQGFERLTASMERAMAEGLSAEDRFRLCGRGYLQFALRWPQHIHVMFDVPAPKKINPEYKQAGDDAFRTLLDCVSGLQREGGLPAGDPLPAAVVAWSAVHGFAKLMIAGRLPFNYAQALDFYNLISRILKEGLRSKQPVQGDRAVAGDLSVKSRKK
jgi:AcrR family transcriptional regulator